MRKRTKAREVALQILYQRDIRSLREAGQESLSEIIGDVDTEIKEFAHELLKGVEEHSEEIDAKISQYATNWVLPRMSVVDRNILRQACFELIYRSDIPPKVTINEAVELAKRFSGEEAGKFVNGILDKIRSELNKD
ncbi:MAG: transcription antitermination factor NusB [Candidatus Omnitrophica bacterium]|nr:transcription antitermination factor NusB [Candidatus Omnitrophota bacterium]